LRSLHRSSACGRARGRQKRDSAAIASGARVPMSTLEPGWRPNLADYQDFGTSKAASGARHDRGPGRRGHHDAQQLGAVVSVSESAASQSASRGAIDRISSSSATGCRAVVAFERVGRTRLLRNWFRGCGSSVRRGPAPVAESRRKIRDDRDPFACWTNQVSVIWVQGQHGNRCRWPSNQRTRRFIVANVIRIDTILTRKQRADVVPEFRPDWNRIRWKKLAPCRSRTRRQRDHCRSSATGPKRPRDRRRGKHWSSNGKDGMARVAEFLDPAMV